MIILEIKFWFFYFVYIFIICEGKHWKDYHNQTKKQNLNQHHRKQTIQDHQLHPEHQRPQLQQRPQMQDQYTVHNPDNIHNTVDNDEGEHNLTKVYDLIHFQKHDNEGFSIPIPRKHEHKNQHHKVKKEISHSRNRKNSKKRKIRKLFSIIN